MGKTIPIVPISRYLVNNKNALVFTTLVVRFESGNPVGQPYFRHKSVICLAYSVETFKFVYLFYLIFLVLLAWFLRNVLPSLYLC